MVGSGCCGSKRNVVHAESHCAARILRGLRLAILKQPMNEVSGSVSMGPSDHVADRIPAKDRRSAAKS